MKVFVYGLLLFSMNLYATVRSENTESALVKSTVKQWMKANDVPGVAVQVYTRGIPHAYFFGVESRKTQKHINEHTIFEVGSWTKLFTCLLLAEEINTGKMKLSDSAKKYVHYLGDAFNQVTLLNLGTHTSGLPFTLPENIKTASAMFSYFYHWKPSSTIGTQWTYSNLGIGLLGNVTQSTTHTEIGKLYVKKLLNPLNMEAIGIEVPKKMQRHYAQGYDAKGQPVPHSSLGLFPAAGSMKMSARDAGLFLGATLQMPGTSSEIMQAMKTTQTAYVRVNGREQGLGWDIYSLNKASNLLDVPNEMSFGPMPAIQIPSSEQIFDGGKLMDKTGATEGFRSYVVVIPDKKSGIAILTNRYVSNGEIMRVGRKILMALNSDINA